VVKVTLPIFNFDVRNHISRMADASVANFCIQVEYIKCYPWDDKLSRNGSDQSHVTRFF